MGSTKISKACRAVGCILATVLVTSRAAGAARAWKPVEQPELKAELDGARPLRVENLVAPARSIQPCGTHVAPNPDGETYDVLQWYQKAYKQKTRLYIVDLGSGEVKLRLFAEEEGGVRPETSRPVLAWDGRMYGATPDWRKWRTGGCVIIYRYDPGTNEFKVYKRIPGLGGEKHFLLLGPDRKLYGGATHVVGTGTHNRVAMYRLDPETGKVRMYAPVGPSHGTHTAFAYSIGVDDTHMYVASGKMPWYLIAVNIESGEEKILMEAPAGDYHNRMWIRPSYPGAWVTVQQGDDAPKKAYWLYHGEAIPKEGSPPWKPKESPWVNCKAPAPKLYTEQLDPDAEGRGRLWFSGVPVPAKLRNRTPWDTPKVPGWNVVLLEGIETYPLKIHRIAAMSDGRIFGTAQGYQGRFVYDPRTGKATVLGRNRRMSPYTAVAHGGKVYVSGYSSAPIDVYDPGRPWTRHKGGPPGHPAPEITSPDSNPRRVGSLFQWTRVKKIFSGAVGADGRVYFGGVGQRDYCGGGFGWYDPKSGEMGGMWKPFSGYAIRWLAPAMDGRCIVISTNVSRDELDNDRMPPEAKVFVYDTTKRNLVQDFAPVSGARYAGPVVEAFGDFVIGTTEDPRAEGRGVLYGADVTTGKVLFNKNLPRAMDCDWGSAHAQWDMQKGPDGFVWTTLGDVLVRIDPRDARVHAVGKIDSQGKFAFVGRDLYLAGAERLRCVRDVVRPGRPR